jgi:hypothetical protein
VIKLFLARNTISFCGLNNIFSLTWSSPGILENGSAHLFPDRSFPGLFPFPARNYLGILGISKQEKLPAQGIEPQNFPLTAMGVFQDQE